MTALPLLRPPASGTLCTPFLAIPLTALLASAQPPQKDSKFTAAYSAGIPKSQYWEPYFEDSIDLIAKLPSVAAAIYRYVHGLARCCCLR